ncbi:MAG: hypothetical protein IJF61_04760 [Clostridia bacterium]|nr:hypothetical protein [Clostridia bacterium]
MQEYLVACQNKWWHFFMKPFYGLCYKTGEGGRFAGFEVLLAEACEDFCAVAIGDRIQLVCQDKAGRIISLTMEEGSWQKTVLLESKSQAPYPKHFSLVPIGRFLNLFYVITYQEKHMLVHQILGGSGQTPTVVDRLTLRSPAFLVARNSGTDLSVFYENESGVSGFRIFRWSKKDFGGFVPVNPALGGLVCGVLPETGDRMHYCALQSVQSVCNLVYFEKTEDGGFTEPVTVNLDCPGEAIPVFCRDGEKLYLSWCENGCVMSSYITDGGTKWTKPVRYMKGSGVEPVLYTVCRAGEIRQAYGFEKDREIVFYIGEGLSEPIEKKQPKIFRPAGYEAEEFAKSMGADKGKVVPEKDPVTEQLKAEFSQLKEQVFSLRRQLSEMTERVERLEKKEKSNGGVAAQVSVN